MYREHKGTPALKIVTVSHLRPRRRWEDNIKMDTFLWAYSGHGSRLGRAIESHCDQAVLQGSPNPPDNSVTSRMSDKGSTHVVKGGVTECPYHI